jgi:uncharacterized membrane protein YhaH (DUF805 family)
VIQLAWIKIMENQQTQPPQTSTTPVEPAPVNPAAGPQPSGQVPTQPTTDSSEKSHSLGMFGRRMGRLSYFLGAIYTLAPLLIVAVLQIINHFIISASSNSAMSSMDSMNNNMMGSSSGSSSSEILNIISVIIGAATIIALIPIGLSLQFRRWHDLGKSGWYILLSLIPFFGSFVGLYLLFAPGKPEDNIYGPPVHSNSFLVVLGFKPPKA